MKKVTVTSTSTTATVSWTKKAACDTGGSGCVWTGYTITHTPADGTNPTGVVQLATSAQVTGLIPGTQYTFNVVVDNTGANGGASSDEVTEVHTMSKFSDVLYMSDD